MTQSPNPNFDTKTQPHFVLSFDDQGTIDYEAVNFTGKSCDQAAKELMAALGAEEVANKRRDKPTYGTVERTTNTQASKFNAQPNQLNQR